MKFATLASLAFAVALTSAFVVPGKEWQPEQKRGPIVAVGVDFDETDASTKRDAEPYVVPGAVYEPEADEKRSYQDGTYKREAWVVVGEDYEETEDKRSYQDGTYKRDAEAEEEAKRSYHDGTYKRDAGAEEAKRGYQDGTYRRDAEAAEEAKRGYQDGTY